MASFAYGRRSSGLRNRKSSLVSEQVPISSLSDVLAVERSNLDCFLDRTVPSIRCQYPPKRALLSVTFEGPETDTSMPFFSLGDLWRSFEEWSAYGVGVPLRFPNGDEIMQYYTPYLSALQIYLQRGFWSKRSDWSDMSEIRDSSSDFWSDTECEMAKLDQWDSSSCVSFERMSSSSTDRGDDHGDLVMDYFETDDPNGRAPLAGKISELAADFPYLHNLGSCQLSPASWLSVAWYPIYRIPIGPTMRNFSTSFLTYHSLWTPLVQATNCGPEDEGAYDGKDYLLHSRDSTKQELEQWLWDRCAWRTRSCTLELPAFGMASYKLRGAFWESALFRDMQLESVLRNSANAWLRQLGVKHPDFDFFIRRG